MSRYPQIKALSAGLLAVTGALFLAGAALAQSPTPVPTVPVPTVPVPAAGSPVSSGAGVAVPAPVIMVVDADRILHEAKAMKALQAQLDAQQQAYQKDLTAKENQLQTEQTDLQRQQSQLPADQFEEKRHAFEKEVVDVRRGVESKKRALDQGAGDSVDKVKRQLVQIVAGIAQARHANLVLLRNAAIIADPAYDVTAEALAQLDQALPSVQLVVRAPDATAATPDQTSAVGAPLAATKKK